MKDLTLTITRTPSCARDSGWSLRNRHLAMAEAVPGSAIALESEYKSMRLPLGVLKKPFSTPVQRLEMSSVVRACSKNA